jgi:putative methyltransferase (TIGR04325 family)
MRNARVALQLVTPPIVWGLAARLLRRHRTLEGPVASWDAALKRATGWDSPGIIEQAVAAAVKVRDGAAAFERDSRTYDRIIYSPAILAALLLAVARYPRLNVIDFGGGLGSNYFQNVKLIRALPNMPLSWNVVERRPLATIGAEQFQTAELRFHAELAAVRLEDAVLMFTGSLQYIADAFGLLEEAIGGIDIVVLDNVLVWPKAEHAVFVQHLDAKRFGPVTLPTWCFAKDALIGWFAARGFVLVEQFQMRPQRHFENCGMLFARS